MAGLFLVRADEVIELRELGVHRLLVSCLNPDCRHEALLDASGYWADLAVTSFIARMKCNWCGDKRVDMRPNWKEQPPRESLTG